MTGRISEVFESIQGEGIYLGERQIFVRLFGCNLDCKFCDTKLSEFKEYQPQELLQELKNFQDKYHSVTFTGGEPLLQKDFLKEVLPLTREAGFRNYLETNGTLPEALEEVIDNLDIVAMDLKLPSSSGMGNLWNLHREFLKIALNKETFLKIVVCEETTDEDLKEALSLLKEANKSVSMVLQPNSYDKADALEGKMQYFKDLYIEEGINTSVIPQMHKVMGIR